MLRVHHDTLFNLPNTDHKPQCHWHFRISRNFIIQYESVICTVVPEYYRTVQVLNGDSGFNQVRKYLLLKGYEVFAYIGIAY